MKKNIIPAQLEVPVIFNTLKDYFSEKALFRLVLIYGSSVNGNFGKHSDIDIAVAGIDALDRELLYTTNAELSALLDREIDLIDLYCCEGLILYKVMTTSRRLKLDASLYVKYQVKALGYKEDFKPLQDAMRDARLQRFIHGS